MIRNEFTNFFDKAEISYNFLTVVLRKKQEHKYKDLLSKMPNIKRIMQPSFCMYLTHMSYYLHPDQFIQLQKRMASSGTQ